MTDRTDTTPLDFTDRLILAHTMLGMVYEAHGILSDDDVLDVTSLWTTSDLCTDDDDVDLTDYEQLRGHLFGLVSPED